MSEDQQNDSDDAKRFLRGMRESMDGEEGGGPLSLEIPGKGKWNVVQDFDKEGLWGILLVKSDVFGEFDAEYRKGGKKSVLKKKSLRGKWGSALEISQLLGEGLLLKVFNDGLSNPETDESVSGIWGMISDEDLGNPLRQALSELMGEAVGWHAARLTRSEESDKKMTVAVSFFGSDENLDQIVEAALGRFKYNRVEGKGAGGTYDFVLPVDQSGTVKNED